MYSAWFVRAVIGSPASYAALKTVVETWHTPPPRPVPSSPLMITGASRKHFAALRSPVDRVRDELDVVDPVRVPAVERLVARDEAGDAHRARLGGRSRRRLRLDAKVREASRRRDGCGEQRARGRVDVERPAVPGGD